MLGRLSTPPAAALPAERAFSRLASTSRANPRPTKRKRSQKSSTPARSPQSSVPTTPVTAREQSATPSDASDLLDIEQSLTPVAAVAIPRKPLKVKTYERRSTLSQSIVIDSDVEDGDDAAPAAGQRIADASAASTIEPILDNLRKGAARKVNEEYEEGEGDAETGESRDATSGGKRSGSFEPGGEEGEEKEGAEIEDGARSEEGAHYEEGEESSLETGDTEADDVEQNTADGEGESQTGRSISKQQPPDTHIITNPTRPRTSTPPSPSTSQLDTSTQLPESAATLPPRKRRAEDRDEELRALLADEEAANAFLASKWVHTPELHRLEKLGVITYKRGKYLEAEKAAVREHLTTFQRVHGLSDEQLIDMIMAKGRYVERSQHPSFWFDIAATVPGRPVAYVKDAVKRMYDPRGRKGLWTRDEDRALIKAYEEYPNQWTQISDIVDRAELDCRDRWKHELRDRATRRTGAWSKEEVDKLITAVNKAASANNLDPAKEGLPWDTIAELMERKRTTAQCRKKWRDHLIGTGELTLPQPTRSRRLDPRLVLQRFRELDVQHENDIAWGDLPTAEWVIKPARLRALWCGLKKTVVVPDRNAIPFQELLDKIEAGLDELDGKAGSSGGYRLPSRIRERRTDQGSRSSSAEAEDILASEERGNTQPGATVTGPGSEHVAPDGMRSTLASLPPASPAQPPSDTEETHQPESGRATPALGPSKRPAVAAGEEASSTSAPLAPASSMEPPSADAEDVPESESGLESESATPWPAESVPAQRNELAHIAGEQLSSTPAPMPPASSIEPASADAEELSEAESGSQPATPRRGTLPYRSGKSAHDKSGKSSRLAAMPRASRVAPAASVAVVSSETQSESGSDPSRAPQPATAQSNVGSQHVETEPSSQPAIVAEASLITSSATEDHISPSESGVVDVQPATSTTDTSSRQTGAADREPSYQPPVMASASQMTAAADADSDSDKAPSRPGPPDADPDDQHNVANNERSGTPTSVAPAFSPSSSAVNQPTPPAPRVAYTLAAPPPLLDSAPAPSPSPESESESAPSPESELAAASPPPMAHGLPTPPATKGGRKRMWKRVSTGTDKSGTDKPRKKAKRSAPSPASTPAPATAIRTPTATPRKRRMMGRAQSLGSGA